MSASYSETTSKSMINGFLDRRTSYLRIMGLVSRRDGLREDDLRFPDDCEPHNLGPSCCRVLAAEFMNYEIAEAMIPLLRCCMKVVKGLVRVHLLCGDMVN